MSGDNKQILNESQIAEIKQITVDAIAKDKTLDQTLAALVGKFAGISPEILAKAQDLVADLYSKQSKEETIEDTTPILPVDTHVDENIQESVSTTLTHDIEENQDEMQVAKASDDGFGAIYAIEVEDKPLAVKEAETKLDSMSEVVVTANNEVKSDISDEQEQIAQSEDEGFGTIQAVSVEQTAEQELTNIEEVKLGNDGVEAGEEKQEIELRAEQEKTEEHEEEIEQEVKDEVALKNEETDSSKDLSVVAATDDIEEEIETQAEIKIEETEQKEKSDLVADAVSKAEVKIDSQEPDFNVELTAENNNEEVELTTIASNLDDTDEIIVNLDDDAVEPEFIDDADANVMQEEITNDVDYEELDIDEDELKELEANVEQDKNEVEVQDPNEWKNSYVRDIAAKASEIKQEHQTALNNFYNNFPDNGSKLIEDVVAALAENEVYREYLDNNLITAVRFEPGFEEIKGKYAITDYRLLVRLLGVRATFLSGSNSSAAIDELLASMLSSASDSLTNLPDFTVRFFKESFLQSTQLDSENKSLYDKEELDTMSDHKESFEELTNVLGPDDSQVVMSMLAAARARSNVVFKGQHPNLAISVAKAQSECLQEVMEKYRTPLIDAQMQGDAQASPKQQELDELLRLIFNKGLSQDRVNEMLISQLSKQLAVNICIAEAEIVPGFCPGINVAKVAAMLRRQMEIAMAEAQKQLSAGSDPSTSAGAA